MENKVNNIEEAKRMEALAVDLKSMSLAMKANEGEMRRMKEELIAYAQKQLEGTNLHTYTFANGVKVTYQDRLKANFNEGKVDPTWFEKIRKSLSACAVTVSINPSKIQQGDRTTTTLLKQIEYKTEESKVWTVQVTQKTVERS